MILEIACLVKCLNVFETCGVVFQAVSILAGGPVLAVINMIVGPTTKQGRLL